MRAARAGPALPKASVQRILDATHGISSKRVMNAKPEFQVLIQAAKPSIIPIGTKSVTATSLIAATSFTPSTVREAANDNDPSTKFHSAACPFAKENVPLSSLFENKSFLKEPCLHCLRKRLNFLASEDFASSLAGKSVAAEATAFSPQSYPQLDDTIRMSFGSVEALQNEVVMYLANRRAPGYSWIVFNAKRMKIEIVNMPRNISPTTVGLWPLAAFDMTDSAVRSAHSVIIENQKTEPSVPTWSRAARNPGAATARLPADLQNGVSLAEARSVLSSIYASRVQWQSLSEHLTLALQYYSSQDRSAKQTANSQKLASVAAKKALLSFNDENGEQVEVAMPTENKAPAAVKSDSKAASAESKETAGEPSAAVDAPKEGAPQQPTQAADGAQQDATTDAAASDYDHSTDNEGNDVFTYANGDKTVVNNTTKVTTYYQKDVTITVFPDEWTHYKYLSGTEQWVNKAGEVFNEKQ